MAIMSSKNTEEKRNGINKPTALPNEGGKEWIKWNCCAVTVRLIYCLASEDINQMSIMKKVNTSCMSGSNMKKEEAAAPLNAHNAIFGVKPILRNHTSVMWRR